jgi:Xaa-Pro aminopeptidase
VKDEDELAVMAEAALLGCKLFEHILGFMRPGIAEVEVAAELEHQARMLGAEGMSFETIVASGLRSAMPHGRATAAPLPRRGFVTLDFGIIHKGYCSDMTRTVFLGKPKPEERDAYHAVLEAQENAVERRGRGRELRGSGRGRAQRVAQGGIGRGIYALDRPRRGTGDSRAATGWQRGKRRGCSRDGGDHRTRHLSGGQVRHPH